MDRLLAFLPYGIVRPQGRHGVNEILRHRIGERVGALKISWRKASLDSGLGPGFIQDIVTGRFDRPSEQDLASLAATLKCSPAFLTGESDEISGAPGDMPAASPSVAEIPQRPDAVMALRIVEELLAGGHVEAARLAARRALKAIALE